MRFLRALASELLKITTTRLWWVLALVLVGYVASLAGGLGALFGWLSQNPEQAAGAPMAIGDNSVPALVYSLATSVGYVMPLLLGAMATTNEFRHETLTPTFLANPRRGGVLVAKAVVLLGVGAVFGVLAWVAAVAPGALALGAFDVDTELGDSDTWAMGGRGVLAMALWAAIGVGLGALVPSQVASVVIVIAFTQFVEPLLRFAAAFGDVTAQIAKFLPGAASDALVGASFFSVAGMQSVPALEWWQGGLVLLALAIATTVGGYLASWRRDVT